MNTTSRLTRSRTDKMIAGVAGGIAQYLGVDPVLVRLVFVLLAFSGASLLVYPLLALIMPADTTPAAGPGQVFVAEGETRRLRIDPLTGQPGEPEQEIPINNVGAGQPVGQSARRGQILGWVLVGLGGFLVLQMIWPGLGSLLFPALLIGAGVYLLRR